MNVLLKDIFYEKSTVQYQVSRRPRCPPLSASPLTRPWRYTTYGLCIQHNRVSSIPYGYRTRGSPSFGCLVYIGLRNIILPFRKQVGYSNITNHNTRILQPHGWCFSYVLYTCLWMNYERGYRCYDAVKSASCYYGHQSQSYHCYK